MLDDQARAELQATFRAELAEHCQALTRAFLALEKEPEVAEQDRLLDEAFRSAHNLKGAARAVALGAIEALAHGMEGLLGVAKRGEAPLSPPLFDVLYAVVDFLAARSAEVEKADADGAVQDLLRQLEAAQAEQVRDAAPPAAAPTSAPPAPAAEPAAPRPAPSLPPAAAQPAPIASETLRLPAARLDRLLEQLGELIVPSMEAADGLALLRALRAEVESWQRDWRNARPMLRRVTRDAQAAEVRALARFLERSDTSLASLGAKLGATYTRLGTAITRLHGLAEELQSEVKRLRMVPFGNLAGTLERVVRDVARSQGKEARLVLVGADTEFDRRVLEEMKDPLLHLLRNALDHGIEPPAERQRLGKPSIGSVAVTATQRGGTIVIEVEDDGGGLDVGAIRHAAGARGLVAEGELATVDDAAAAQLIFLPGLSTRGGADEISGRGVGLDVVARNVERLGGRVEVQSTAGRGTRFALTLPLTLATMRVVLVEARGMLYALPTNAIERIVRAEQLRSIGGRSTVALDGAAVPVVVLADLLGPRGTRAPDQPGGPKTLLLLRVGTQRVALTIDRVGGEQEIVVKPLGYPLLRVRYVAGATILGSGRVVPVLHPGDLARAAGKGDAVAAPARPPQPEQRQMRVLIVEDSLTTGTLERYILQAAGYDVALARDGLEALARLRDETFDVVVSDVDMPGLNGVDLTAKVREDARLHDLPVILVTSLESPEDRQRGLQAGADAYIVKSSFDQDDLLRTIREHV